MAPTGLKNRAGEFQGSDVPGEIIATHFQNVQWKQHHVTLSQSNQYVSMPTVCIYIYIYIYIYVCLEVHPQLMQCPFFSGHSWIYCWPSWPTVCTAESWKETAAAAAGGKSMHEK